MWHKVQEEMLNSRNKYGCIQMAFCQEMWSIPAPVLSLDLNWENKSLNLPGLLLLPLKFLSSHPSWLHRNLGRCYINSQLILLLSTQANNTKNLMLVLKMIWMTVIGWSLWNSGQSNNCRELHVHTINITYLMQSQKLMFLHNIYPIPTCSPCCLLTLPSAHKTQHNALSPSLT